MTRRRAEVARNLERNLDRDRAPEVRSRGEPSRGRAWLTVFILLLFYAAAFLDRQVLSLMVGPLKSDLRITNLQISILNGLAFAAFYAVCGLPIGWAVDRFSRRRVVFVGLLVWSASTAAGGLARDFTQLLLCRFGVGAGEAALSPAAFSIIAGSFSNHRLAGALAVFSLGAVLGAALSFVAGGMIVDLAVASHGLAVPILGELRPWQMVLLASGAPGLLLLPLVFLLTDPPRAEPARAGSGADARGVGATARFLLAHRGFFLCHFLGFGLFSLTTIGLTSWAPTYLANTFHWPVARIGWSLGLVFLVAGTAGTLGSGLIVDRLVRRGMTDAHLRVYVIATLVCGAAGITAVSAGRPAVFLGGYAIVMATGTFMPVAAAALQAVTPSQFRGQVSSLFLLTYYLIGYAGGPALVAALTDHGFGGDAFLGRAIAATFAIVIPIAALLLWMGQRPMRRAIDTADASRW